MFYPSVAGICKLFTSLLRRIKLYELKKARTAVNAENQAHKELLRAETEAHKASKAIHNIKKIFGEN